MLADVKPLKVTAYDALMERLLGNRLRPGEIINRRAIAAELGMSVGPVLEAFVQLEAEGFFETLPRKGTRVRLIRPEDVAGNLIVREALECQAARLYVGAPVKAKKAELLELAAAVDESYGSGLGNWQTEISFHRTLVDLAGIDALTRTFRRVMRVNLFFQLNMVNDPRVQKDRSSHVKFTRALAAASDADAAETLVRAHVQRGKAIH